MWCMRCSPQSIVSWCCTAASSSRAAIRAPGLIVRRARKSTWESKPMSDPLLEVRGIDVFYDDFQALFGVLLCVNAGEVVRWTRANGAGKSTLLKSIAGLMPLGRGEIVFDGARISAAAAFDVVKRGIALVPEGRRLFPSLHVEENLLIGGQSRRPGPWTLKRVYELFPVLAERRRLPAPAPSGGQQQMAAIAPAPAATPP